MDESIRYVLSGTPGREEGGEMRYDYLPFGSTLRTGTNSIRCTERFPAHISEMEIFSNCFCSTPALASHLILLVVQECGIEAYF